jgi:ABC-type lipoprotein export system ATPase subunit
MTCENEIMPGKDTIRKITVIGGCTKTSEREELQQLEIEQGEILVLVGPTGSGKSMLLADIELLAQGDTPSGRVVLVNDGTFTGSRGEIIAQLSQTMNFVMDTTVEEFLHLHADSRNISDHAVVHEVISLANSLAGEPFKPGDYITTLSGGQSRSLMIADIARISNSPVVLVDEIENAGIDKLRALELLSDSGKIVIVATHDPVIMLMTSRRVVMQNGGMSRILETTKKEKTILDQIISFDTQMSGLRESLRTRGTVEES